MPHFEESTETTTAKPVPVTAGVPVTFSQADDTMLTQHKAGISSVNKRTVVFGTDDHSGNVG